MADMDEPVVVEEPVVGDEVQPNTKTSPKKRKSKDTASTSKAKKTKRSNTGKATKKDAETKSKKKKRPGILDDLTPQRRREINHIIRRAKKHDIITPSFITSALRSAKLASDKVGRVEEYKATLAKQREHSLQKAKDEEKKKRVETQFKRKFDRLLRIKDSFSKGNRVCLKAADEVFLSKIKLPKALSGYMLFAKESRGSIQTTNPEAGFGEIGRLIGSEWNLGHHMFCFSL